MPEITIYEKYNGEFECQYNGDGERISNVTRMVTGNISEDSMHIIKYRDLELAKIQMRKEFEKIIELI